MEKWLSETEVVEDVQDIHHLVQEKLLENPERDEPFFVGNLQEVVEKYRLWEQNLAGVEMFYATKANDDENLLKVLKSLGASFDCASKGEIEKVLGLGVSVDKVMYSNPYKLETHLKRATALGVRWMVCDSPGELMKIATICPQAKVVIRILPEKESTDYILMSSKFGCRSEEALALASLARDLGVSVQGISFYVGHCTNSPAPYADAIAVAREVFEGAKSMGHPVHLIDMGGGFPAPREKRNLFIQVAATIRTALSEHFGFGNKADQESPKMRFVGEPGQYIGVTAFEVYARVIGVRRRQGKTENEEHQAVYLSSGHFGCIPNYNFKYNKSKIHLVHDKKPLSERPLLKSNFWGPTCDPMDNLVSIDSFPALDKGDWVRLDHMGAYTRVLGTRYNGFDLAPLKYFCSHEVSSLLEGSSELDQQNHLNEAEILNGVNGN